LLIFSIIFGCEKSIENSYSIKLVPLRKIEIPLDENTSSSWENLQYLDLGEIEYLVFNDGIKSLEKKIHFTNVIDTSDSFEVNVSLEGPDGVGHLDGFYIRNLDSIFILNRFAYRLYLVDSSGSVKETYPLLGSNFQVESNLTYLPGILPFCPILDLGNQLFIPARPDVNPLDNYNYKAFKTGVLLDLTDKSFEYVLDFPKSYHNSGFWGIWLEMPSNTINLKDSLILQSFPIEDRLMVYDFNLNLIDTPSLFSEYYVGKFSSLPESTLDPEIFYPHIYSNPSNKSILFDPYRDLYYRIFNGPYPETTIENMARSNFLTWDEKNEYPKRMIMVFDRNFKELGIIELDNERYFVDFIRVVKEGLLIPVQSDYEDKKVFEIFEVKY